MLYPQGCHLYKDRTSGLAQADDRLAEAAMYAEVADITIACVGLDATLEGEEGDTGNEYFSGDKKDLLIPESQRRLMKVLEKKASRLVTVITAGSSLNVSEGNAKVFTWYPGQAGGTALAELLFGEKNFGGHLPLTFYRDISDLPDFEDYSMSNRTYRYFTGQPLYPFGHGLSYTQFRINRASADDEGKTVNAEIENTGARSGDALVQIYVSCESSYAPVHPRLCGFLRVSLQQGEKKAVCIPLDKLTDTVINDRGEPEKAAHYTLYAGLSQPDEMSIALCGAKPVIINK